MLLNEVWSNYVVVIKSRYTLQFHCIGLFLQIDDEVITVTRIVIWSFEYHAWADVRNDNGEENI